LNYYIRNNRNFSGSGPPFACALGRRLRAGLLACAQFVGMIFHAYVLVIKVAQAVPHTTLTPHKFIKEKILNLLVHTDSQMQNKITRSHTSSST
jgi:hypothetical protein